ncbi:hypothetical protein Q5H93_15660 [Hymenobacter sp. ASUV-10]|uniref:Outer membrane protein beta-barrel domain-containing protein n=1 Tax=Hymenobacter aranciens TaxID=3063996 RepID=A0ABT9BD40_9BACT|nr:hypothetical protein [Hymenobacter sp. ASUV-10]MDO7876181.1 hypothetical protein [Hymenobacter sp. ASUV-10]
MTAASLQATLLGFLLLPLAAPAQRLEALGLGYHFTLGQTWARQRRIQVEEYVIETDTDASRTDDTGDRFSAFARFGLGAGRWFAQPELAYTSVLGQQSSIAYYPTATAPYPQTVSYLYPRLRRAEVALLAGRHLGKRLHLLAGPVLALHRRQSSADYPTQLQPLYGSLFAATRPVQLLGQVGLGLQLWRFELSARYEHSLTPFTQSFTYQQQTYAYHQRTSQFMLGLALLVYDRHRPWRP